MQHISLTILSILPLRSLLVEEDLGLEHELSIVGHFILLSEVHLVGWLTTIRIETTVRDHQSSTHVTEMSRVYHLRFLAF